MHIFVKWSRRFTYLLCNTVAISSCLSSNLTSLTKWIESVWQRVIHFNKLMGRWHPRLKNGVLWLGSAKGLQANLLAKMVIVGLLRYGWDPGEPVLKVLRGLGDCQINHAS